jgi:beta-galactosidase
LTAIRRCQEGTKVEDELAFSYQTETWGEPSQLMLTAEKQDDGRIYVEARMFDEEGVLCPDASHFIRFGLCEDGRLLEGLGTIHGSQLVQLASGCAGIYVDPQGGRLASIGETAFISAGGPAMAAVKASKGTHTPISILSAKCEGMATAFITLK